MVGRGAFGDVMKAMNTTTGSEIAHTVVETKSMLSRMKGLLGKQGCGSQSEHVPQQDVPHLLFSSERA